MYEAGLNLSVEDKRNGNDIMELGSTLSVAAADKDSVNQGAVRAFYTLFAKTLDYGRRMSAILSILLLRSLPRVEVIR